MTNTDRLTFTILTLAFLLLIAGMIAVIMWADVQIQRWEQRAVDAETELADARRERTMLMDALKGLGEGTVRVEPKISDRD